MLQEVHPRARDVLPDLVRQLQRVVFVKNGPTVKMQKVETGIADNTFIEIRSGLKPGDEVVSGSYTAISRRLKDGVKVEIEKEKT